MRKTITATSFAISTFVTSTLPVLAAPTVDPCKAGGSADKLGTCGYALEDIGTLISKGITIAFIAAAIVALAYLIWGGFKWITSGGDKHGVEGARNQIIAAIIGLIIVFVSWIILNIVVTALTGNGLNNIVIPTLKKD